MLTSLFNIIYKTLEPKVSTKIKYDAILDDNKKYCGLGWDLYPIVCNSKGKAYYSRKVEMEFNSKYYPTGTIGEWPIDPETGKRLELYKSK